MEEILRLFFGGGILAFTLVEYKNASRYYKTFARVGETKESTIDSILERKTDDFFEFNSLAIKGQAIWACPISPTQIRSNYVGLDNLSLIFCCLILLWS